ncbi:AfsR/SARP family transcriptional regulator [Streptomyces johnsoniae]|uniref:BTAD domain-containing putative transcriptional regulator n=1 Tax=Streptomyces johnsoniae TaxID=3075532 RepID=A0ABU2S5S6_9ACTN|nr:BTAD domain-containing putative transcriptional regulator [Streptomyces sp. DSM 41886]MDT0444265.1 BTAD domain-containing putative transcriptional regulator [Streptomyces sp. DSM 41886]
MEFVVLGPAEIRRADGRGEPVTGRLQRVLLGVLLARANQAVPVDVLTEALWGERPDARAGQRLHLHVHRLRGTLGEPDRLSFGPDGYRLRVLPGEVDAERFEARVGEGVDLAGRDPRRAVGVLRQALALWHGVPFAETDVPALGDWAHRLAERRLVAHEALCEAEVACGAYAAVIGELTGLVREHPLRERLHGLLMIALYRSGRQSEALAAYREARETLVEELGLEPGPELRELERRMLAGEPVNVGGEGQPQVAVPAQLPGDVTGFAGREAELAELDGLLSGTGPAVVSAVTGTAGVGKTALAVRWAHRVRERFPDGQLYVDLRGYGPDQPVAPEDALGGFLRGLGLDGAAIPQDTAERAARFRTLVDRRRMLVVLDNARSVEQVRPLLPGSPACFALVTSRDALAGLVAREGAHRVSLERLSRGEARDLLREALGARVAAEPAATDALIERCARLPLALRITAELARSRPASCLADLAHELADQQGSLDLLDADGDPHTAVRAVFSWSYRRLGQDVARVFRLLGLHPGHDTDAYAVAAMAGLGPREARRALTVLLRAHLVDQVSGGRYQPHDLLRAYAAELAAATDGAAAREAALNRLLDFYLSTASAAMDAVTPYESYRRPKVPAWGGEAPPLASHDHALRWLDAERDNLLEIGRHGDAAFTIDMAETIWRYLDIGGYLDELITLSVRELRESRAVGNLLTEAHARGRLGLTLSRLGRDHEEAISHLQQSLTAYEQAGEPELQAIAHNNLGIANVRRGKLSKGLDHFELALARNGPTGPWTLRRAATVNMVVSLKGLGRYEEALGHMENALELCRRHGDETNESNVRAGLAELCALMGRGEQAREQATRALAMARKTGYRGVEGDCLRLLGVLCRERGDHEQALALHQEALTLAHDVGDAGSLIETSNELAATHAAAGHPAAALRLYDEAVALATEADQRKSLADTHAGAAAVHAGLGAHDEARAHWHLALGHYEALDLPQAADVRARLAAAERADGADGADGVERAEPGGEVSR